MYGSGLEGWIASSKPNFQLLVQYSSCLHSPAIRKKEKKRRCCQLLSFKRTSLLIIFQGPEPNQLYQAIRETKSLAGRPCTGGGILSELIIRSRICQVKEFRETQSSARQCRKRDMVIRRLNNTYFLKKCKWHEPRTQLRVYEVKIG